MSYDIAFPTVTGGSTLVVPQAPPTNQSDYLASKAATPETRKTLSCKALLQGATLTEARCEAQTLSMKITGNTQIVMTYGNGAVEEINGLIDRLMHDVEPEKIPELTDIVNDLMRDMRGVRRKYDPSDDKIRQKYENYKGGALRIFGNIKTLAEVLMDDVKPLDAKMEKVETKLRGRAQRLIRNTAYYDELYDKNTDAINKLITVIGVMELTRDIVAEKAAGIIVGDSSLGDRGAENKAVLAEVANNLDIRIGEFKNRLFIAWATQPRIRMMRSLNVTLAGRLDNLIMLTIPTMKQTIVEWRMLMETMDAGKLGAAVQAASNESLQALASAGAVLVPQIARNASYPTLSVASVSAMAKSVEDQAQGVLDAFDEAATARSELDGAMVQASTSMRESVEKLSDGLIDRIVADTKRPLEIATSVSA